MHPANSGTEQPGQAYAGAMVVGSRRQCAGVGDSRSGLLLRLIAAFSGGFLGSSQRRQSGVVSSHPAGDLAHKRLDEAVFAAYGRKSDLSDKEILERLLSLNLERSK